MEGSGWTSALLPSSVPSCCRVTIARKHDERSLEEEVYE